MNKTISKEKIAQVTNKIIKCSLGKWYVGRTDGAPDEVVLLDDVLRVMNELLNENEDKHWIDNADSYICPICGFETNSPARYEGCKCPKCGFQDKKDKEQEHAMKFVGEMTSKEKIEFVKNEIKELSDWLEKQSNNWIRYTKNMEMGELKEFKAFCQGKENIKVILEEWLEMMEGDINGKEKN